MFKADIAWSDLSHIPEWKQEAIVLGGGRIVPYQHAALETLLVRTEGRWFAVIRERRVSVGSGDTIAVETVTAERYNELYRSCLLWPLDYVMIEVALQGRRIKLRAGVLGSAPVYCRVTEERVAVSWDFADFLGRHLPIDLEVAGHALALDDAYSARQMCTGVTLLTERATLYMEPGKIRYQYPAAVEAPVSMSLQEGDDATAAFGELLHRVITMRPMTAKRVATELSGGMDSATVACALAALYGPVTSLGILLHDDSRQSQIERRRQIVKRLDLRDRTVDIAALPPSLDLQPGARKEYVYMEYYLEAFEALWGAARTLGCDLMLTGLGGDELFMPFYDKTQSSDEVNPKMADSRRYAERILTPRGLNAARTRRAFDAPPGPVPAILAGVCQAPHLLRHGLWPINPLSDPKLVAFCYGLAPKHRHRRETMWQYLRARLGDEVFPRLYTKETFGQVFPGLIAKQKEAIAVQLQECALSDLGLIDRQAVLALLDEVATTQAVAPTSALVNFLWLERFVRQVI
jgi:asparagine synthase (glutamine-hydrolysing)